MAVMCFPPFLPVTSLQTAWLLGFLEVEPVTKPVTRRNRAVTLEGLIRSRHKWQAADPACAFHRAAEVRSPRAADCGHVVAVALLDDAHAVVNVAGLRIQHPLA